ncbi:MAG: hypothetical protein LBK12_08635 [Odoribacteraceae bacterium]|jgi:hypothetical protein|nr:hypothetical protein [Odoribacteraceae bacterium]
MALTEQEEASVRQIIAAMQDGKRISDLPLASGLLSKMHVPVVDEDGETRKMNLSEAVSTASNPVAGRYWNELNTTPVAGYYGSLSALKELPKKLGLGRYLVTDDRARRKLDPVDSTRYEDGSPARLDGSQGQCMWCWNAHYYTTWKEGNNTVEVITFLPVTGKNSTRVPAGGVSWLGGGVIDRTDQKLCSLISDDPRYRGGNGSVLSAYTGLDDGAPQKTQLGMVGTALALKNFSAYARKRGEGWDANWYVARAVVEYTTRILLGTRNSQAAYNPALDADGLMQGGLGAGVTTLNSTTWNEYNGYYPIVPTSVGLEKGDGTGVIEYSVTKGDGTSIYTAPVPVFFGLVHPFGHVWNVVSGMIFDVGEEKSPAYVAPSLYAGIDWTALAGMSLVGELPRASGYIKKLSMHKLCCLPTEVGGSSATCFCDYYYTNWETSRGFRVRLSGGSSHTGTNAGAFVTDAYYAGTSTAAYVSSSLCFFDEDPLMGE